MHNIVMMEGGNRKLIDMKLSTGQNLFNALKEKTGYYPTYGEMSDIVNAVEADNGDEVRSKEEIEERIREFQSKLEDMEYYGIKDLHYEHELHLRIKELEWVLKQNE